MKTLSMALVLAAMVAGGAGHGRAQQPGARPVTCKIDQPQADQTVIGRVWFSATLGNLPARRLKARVEGFGVVHHFVLEPRSVAAGSAQPPVKVEDGFLPFRRGTHTLRLAVFAADEPEPVLVDETITFTVAKREKVDRYRWETGRRVDQSQLRAAERMFAALKQRAGFDGSANPKLRKAADDLQRARVCDLFITRLANLSSRAGFYLEAHDPPRALACLQTAARLYDREAPTLSQHPLGGEVPWQRRLDFVIPPSFLTELGDFHARYAHLEESIACRKREIAFLQECLEATTEPKVRRSALHSLARAHQRVADVYVLLADDMRSYEEWHAKAEALSRQARDS